MGTPIGASSRAVIGSADVVVHSPDASGFQSETAIAANDDGSILVAGYNDSRGKIASPPSVAGIARSADGGVTWAEVGVGPEMLGVLPSPASTELMGSPDVAYDPVSDRFIYASIFRRADSRIGIALLRSGTGDDLGLTWGTPIEVTSSFVNTETASRPSIDINPTTGRVWVAWVQTQAGGASRIVASFSDDLTVAFPDNGIDLATAPAGGAVEAPAIAVDPETDNSDSPAYAVWAERAAAGERNIGCARTTNGGGSWSAATDLEGADFPGEDTVAGIESAGGAPALAVDHTGGDVYVAYQKNNAEGTGDIALRQWNGDCAAGAAATPTMLSPNPGQDGAQLHPAIALDQGTRAVHVMYLDQSNQGIAGGADSTDALLTTSTDQGATFGAPTPILDRPFRAGFGRIAGQPHLGAYSGCTATGGNVHCAVAATSPVASIGDGSVDTFYDQRSESAAIPPARVACVGLAPGECDGVGIDAIKPGGRVDIYVTLENYVGNDDVGAATLTNVSATLSSNAAGVSVASSDSDYADIAANTTAVNATAFTLELTGAVSLGAPIEMFLQVSSTQGIIELPVVVATGSFGDPETIFSESFDDGSDSALPEGWSSINGATESADPDNWIVSTTITETRAAFHDNDGELSEHWILESPAIGVPDSGNAALLEVSFDLVFRLQDNPDKLVEAFDGLTLSIANKSSDPEQRVLASAFAQSIVSGAGTYYPKRLPEVTLTDYLSNVGVWSGDSEGVVPVTVRLPARGLGGSDIALRFEYTEDASGDCVTAGQTGPCGVAVDNVEVRHVRLDVAADLAISSLPRGISVESGESAVFGINVQNRGPDRGEGIVVTSFLPEGAEFVSAFGDGFECTEAEAVVTCTLSELEAGSNTAVVLQYTAPDGEGEITSNAEVTAASFDPDVSNNVAGLQATLEDGGCGCQVDAQRPMPWTLGLILFAVLGCVRWRARRRRRR